jgi:hypothetical protein
MASSALVGIVCAGLVVVLILMLVGYQLWQRFSKKEPESVPEPEPETEETAPKPLQPVPPPVPDIPAVPVAVVATPATIEPEPVQEPEYNPEILSKDIVAQLKDASPAQAEAVKSQYLGLKVYWTLYFSYMLMKSARNMEVTLLNENNDNPMVSFQVDFVENPQVNQLRQGMQVEVKGQIHQVYNQLIILKDVQFSFTPPPSE